MDMNLFSIIWICAFCLGGAMCITLSMYLKRKANNLIVKCTSTCKGVLNEICEKLREYRDEDGRHNRKKIYYFPIYEFEVNEKKYRIRDTTGNLSLENFKIGEIVEIKYNPENPEECYKEGDSFSKVWLVFLIVGCICIIEGIGIGFLIKIIF